MTYNTCVWVKSWIPFISSVLDLNDRTLDKITEILAACDGYDADSNYTHIRHIFQNGGKDI